MIVKVPFSGNVQNLMRQCGYYFERMDGKTGEMVFCRPVEAASASGYPRFHIYLSHSGAAQEILLKLHLDQKKPIHKGVAAHSGEYSGTIVEREAERIKRIIGGP